ncbi:homoserine O-acetyltransferase/O-succinyltransferase family protein [Flexivirga alba]|uniref:Homoserine O-succinyltransferase n=1 Tax=Flexivirga alba TaxID=702742 RepID=A0ABW2AG84_9MICO
MRSPFLGVTHTSSLMLSCLATHAALLHFAGVSRTPSERKLSGVFQQNVVQGSPLTMGLPASVRVPHSRKNGVAREVLEAVGYDVLIGAGQDVWTVATRQMSGCLIVALQGHPEYDAPTLLLEYRRDVQQFQLGRREDHPDIPVDYLDLASVDLLARYRERCVAARRAGKPTAAFPYDDVMWRVTSPWKSTASVLYGNWVNEVCRRSELPPRRRGNRAR